MLADVFLDTSVLVYAALGARTVYSEDLNDRQRYGQLRVVNPFKTA